MTKIAIIGAGLAGLTLANFLKGSCNVTVFEKARGVSGRMSTRRAEPYFFDHGAQYFTARTPEFKNFIQPYIEQGLIKRWNARYVQFDGTQIVQRHAWPDDEPRYVSAPAMNSFVKELAKDLNIKLQTRIVSMSRQQDWILTDDNGVEYAGFDWVISTAPAPQTAELMPRFFEHYADVQACEMQGCLSVMLGFEKDLHLEFDAAHVKNSDISWLAVNSAKPDRLSNYSLMIHSTAAYAHAHIDGTRSAAQSHLIDLASRITECDLSAAPHKAIHGWRFANNAKHDLDLLLIDKKHHLAACGDWCEGGRVEGAFISAYKLMQVLNANIQ